MLLMMLAGWINRQQPEMIDYLKDENKIFREKLGRRYYQKFAVLFLVVSQNSS